MLSDLVLTRRASVIEAVRRARKGVGLVVLGDEPEIAAARALKYVVCTCSVRKEAHVHVRAR